VRFWGLIRTLRDSCSSYFLRGFVHCWYRLGAECPRFQCRCRCQALVLSLQCSHFAPVGHLSLAGRLLVGHHQSHGDGLCRRGRIHQRSHKGRHASLPTGECGLELRLLLPAQDGGGVPVPEMPQVVVGIEVRPLAILPWLWECPQMNWVE
jgi:hypothetical protein